MKITVTADHIAKGERGCICKCPIALAMKSLGYKNPWVECNKIYWDVGWNSYKKEMPPSAKEFIKAFDIGLPVEPFEFEFEL